MPRFYDEFAEWWPLFSPAEDYVEEAADLLARIGPAADGRRRTLLELGAGGGNLASHLKEHFELTLTDLAPGMVAESRRLNPESTHLVGDMRTLRLARQFDVVLIHDAIMYATTREDARATLATAASHCAPRGQIVMLPDWVRETFTPGTEEGGGDGADGRALRYLEWSWDPDPDDCTYRVDYAFLLRSPDGSVEVVHDTHVEGLFSRADWLDWFGELGFTTEVTRDPWGRDVFIARRV